MCTITTTNKQISHGKLTWQFDRTYHARGCGVLCMSNVIRQSRAKKSRNKNKNNRWQNQNAR